MIHGLRKTLFRSKCTFGFFSEVNHSMKYKYDLTDFDHMTFTFMNGARFLNIVFTETRILKPEPNQGNVLGRYLLKNEVVSFISYAGISFLLF